MSDFVLVLGVAAITFATRVAFLLKPREAPGGQVGRFLEVFPLALFTAIATNGLASPAGPQQVANIAAAIGGVVGGVVFRRSLWGVVGVGAACFYLARALVG